MTVGNCIELSEVSLSHCVHADDKRCAQGRIYRDYKIIATREKSLDIT